MPTSPTLTADDTTIVRVFASAFHAAPTQSLIDYGAAALAAGSSEADVFDFLFGITLPGSPFTDYLPEASNLAFCTALVDNFCYATEIGSATRTGWVDYLLAQLPGFASRGALAASITDGVAAYAGDDADLLALQAAVAARIETATAFAQSDTGATWDGAGWQQLLDPLVPPPPLPVYDLVVSAEQVNEGQSVTFTLLTQHVEAGTSIAFSLAGTGITTDDLVGGASGGTFVVGSDGRAEASFQLRQDQSTEGDEMLRLEMADGLGAIGVLVKDTSLTPAPVATYAVTASASHVAEGDDLTFTLNTTNVAVGSVIAFSLSGTGITSSDIVASVLSGSFTVGADGSGSFTLTIAADATTEGAEVLHLQLTGHSATLDTTIDDTSLTPPPTPTKDLVVIADAMSNSNAESPPTPREGELRLETYLTYDLLDQSGNTPERMTLAELRATSATAGAALNTSNHKADRGNIPQVSNQDLFSFNLGEETDRVDYSAESGKIVAIVSASAPTDRQYVLVNDDAVDDTFDDATDRIDTLDGVEEIVASKGGGVIDLTRSGRDWRIDFSRNYDDSSDVVAAKDREVHQTVLIDDTSGDRYDRTYLDFRDAGLSANISQATAAWTQVQGSDHGEILSFTAYESTDDRLNVLRGGDNAVEFNHLTRSILADVAITPWAESTSLADDDNGSGLVVVSTTFTNGISNTLLSPAVNVTSSHTPDNRVAAGSLVLAGTQDAEDTLSFDGTPMSKAISLGSSTTVRLLASDGGSALRATGFEMLLDNGASDDLYIIPDLSAVLGGNPELIDAGGSDHDAVRIFDESLGSVATGGSATLASLAALVGGAGLDYDFDVLDLSALTETGLTAIGTADSNDELVLGPLATVSTVSAFEAVVLTEASTDQGTSLKLDLDSGRVQAGSTTLFSYTGSVLSANGTVFGDADQTSPALPMHTAMQLSIVDTSAGAGGTLWGGSGNDTLLGADGDDTLRGGAGNDSLEGGDGDADVFVFEASGTANGSDTLTGFTAGGDKLDVTAFTETAITSAGASINAVNGGTLAGDPAQAEFIFNKAGGLLSVSDFVTSAAAGKYVIPDGGDCVVTVTADPTGSAGDSAETPMMLYYVSNGSVAGLADLTVSLVATISADNELTLAEIFTALG